MPHRSSVRFAYAVSSCVRLPVCQGKKASELCKKLKVVFHGVLSESKDGILCNFTFKEKKKKKQDQNFSNL